MSRAYFCAGLPWFFDVAETGEGLADDPGTHVVDLVQWTGFPDQSLDYRTDVQILGGRRWPTVISQPDFQRVPGEPDFPPYLGAAINNGKLDYYCNNSVHYTLRGVHVKLDILWNWEAPEGTGDAYEATFRGTKSRVEIRQGKADHYTPELYVVPESGDVLAALSAKVDALQSKFPGLSIHQNGSEAPPGDPRPFPRRATKPASRR